MAGERFSGVAAGSIGAGALLVYAGLKGYSVPQALKSMLSGKPPSTGQAGGQLATVAVEVGNGTSTGTTGGGAGSGAFTGSASAIASYAAGFAGKLPYVWGGTILTSGCDCSGFVQAVYAHFRISAPRTSEAQGAWVTRTATPVAGGLAFYHSPPGGPDPGHVAVIASGGQVISQGGGMGPQVEPINFLPLLWTGVPP